MNGRKTNVIQSINMNYAETDLCGPGKPISLDTVESFGKQIEKAKKEGNKNEVDRLNKR